VIAFIGSVFSPYYAWARRHGRGDPLNHCTVNVVLTGAGGARWCMTERGRGKAHRDAASLAIGPSSLDWDGTALTIRVDETTMPVPSRVRGTIRVHPPALTPRAFALDDAGQHRWWPISPRCRVEVALDQPGTRWSGTGYFDTNAGDEALEDAFSQWDWCRADFGGDSAVLYNVDRRVGSPLALALMIGQDGTVDPFEPLPRVTLPASRWWRIPRPTRADPGQPVSVTETLVDAPFYARSVLATHIGSRPATAIHESLSLDRFRAGWVQAMLPFRMPRLG
jgi:carotenoid 1,2-hydratase